jgi:hypothetical protein
MKALSNIHSLPEKIIIHGIQFSISLITLSFFLYFFNSPKLSYELSYIIFEIAKISMVIFAESIIGGLIVDYYIKRSSSK